MKYVDRIKPICRLGSFLLVLVISVSAILLRSADADIARFLSGAGEEAMSYPDAPLEPARVLQLNGVRLSFRAQTIAASLDEVLFYYESLCTGPDAGVVETLSVQTARSKDAGHVACIDMDDGPRDLGSLADRFLRFSETGDLGALGALRYAHARRVTETAGDHTFVVTVWADAGFDLFRMLPIDGADAGGSDVVAVPRPPRSQRIMSAWEAGSPSGFAVYQVRDKSAAELESFYRSELPAKGWTIIERHPSESIVIDDIRTISAERGNRSVMVLARSTAASSTVLSILISEPT